jgi:hypothetical protein
LGDKSFRATLNCYVVELRQRLKKGDQPIQVTPYQPLLVVDPSDSPDRDLIIHESGKLVSQAEYLFSLAINRHAGDTINLSTMLREIEQILAVKAD